jgi:transmembrane sensor
MKPEQLLTDETFLAWYFRTDSVAIKKWERLLSEEPDLKAGVEEAVYLLQLMQNEEDSLVSEQQIDDAGERLMAEIRNREEAMDSKFRLQRIIVRWGLSVAACLLLAVGIVWQMRKESDDTVYIAADQMRELKLVDGTTVQLNKGSGLKVTGMTKEGTGNREVWLKGEAFFDVTHLTNNRRFIVHSGNLNVAVLGTRFNVKNSSGKTAVALESGKVELSVNNDHSQKLVMKPGELVEYSTSSERLIKTAINVRNYSAWQSGKVIFENAELPEIRKALEDRFGLKVYVEQDSELGEFNGVFPTGDPSLLIQALEKAYPEQIVCFEGGVRFKKAVQ